MRSNYTAIAAKYANIGKGKVRLTQSSLLLIQNINTTKSNYIFPVLEQDTVTGTPKVEEIRLNQNDEFVMTGMGLYLVARVSAARNGGEAVPYKGIALFTYPHLNQVGAAGAADPFYNGALKIAVNNVVYVEKWDTMKHKLQPITQIVNSAEATGVAGAVDSNDFAKDAMYPVQPMVTLSGAKKNEITMNMPDAGAGYTFSVLAANGDTVTYTISEIALFIRGYLAQNASAFQ